MPGNPADQSRPTPDHQKELLKLFGSLAYRHSAWQVFADFAEAAAISLSNAVDWAQRDQREERYMALIKRYKPEELAVLPQMLGELALALEEEPSDVLGRTFHDLELHNKWSGQYFSPYPLCRMMAKMTLSNEEDIRSRISERGFVTAQEPACGSGAMVIALAHGMKDLGINYQQPSARDRSGRRPQMRPYGLSAIRAPPHPSRRRSRQLVVTRRIRALEHTSPHYGRVELEAPPPTRRDTRD